MRISSWKFNLIMISATRLASLRWFQIFTWIYPQCRGWHQASNWTAPQPHIGFFPDVGLGSSDGLNTNDDVRPTTGLHDDYPNTKANIPWTHMPTSTWHINTLKHPSLGLPGVWRDGFSGQVPHYTTRAIVSHVWDKLFSLGWQTQQQQQVSTPLQALRWTIHESGPGILRNIRVLKTQKLELISWPLHLKVDSPHTHVN